MGLNPKPPTPSPAPLAAGLAFVLTPEERAAAVAELVDAFAADDVPPKNNPPPMQPK